MYKAPKPRIRNLKLVWLLLALLLASCGGSEPASLADSLPDMEGSSDLKALGEVETFDSETIFRLVNGQAEAFFAYGFEQAAVRRYESAGGTKLDAEVWRLATPADAYGLFTSNVAGEPADIGNEGDGDPGRRIAFWQDRYAVSVRARQQVDDALLRQLAEAISAALPAGGERPALMDRLPPDGLVERSTLFFHEELSIQNELWLGGENLLGLGPETDGVLARYELGGGEALLLLVQYPDAASASAGLEALRQACPEHSRRTQDSALEGGEVEDLVAASAQGNLLGAVFGEVGEAAIGPLLEEALK